MNVFKNINKPNKAYFKIDIFANILQKFSNQNYYI